MLLVKEDVLPFRHFPQQQWRKILSANLLELVNEELQCGTRVVDIILNDVVNGLQSTVFTAAWWVRCFWSRTITRSWNPAACSQQRAWPPSQPLVH